MILQNLPLARSTVDADANSRNDPQIFEDLVEDAATRVILVQGSQLGITSHELALLAVTDLPAGAWQQHRLLYLGKTEGFRFVGLMLPEDLGFERDLDGIPITEEASLVELVESLSFRHLRDIGDRLSDRDAGLGTTAVALTAWHERNPRCPRCGEATEMIDAGWVRRCLVDHSLHFPRTDPAVIMAVTDAEDRILLGHAAHWPQGRFSTLAGYVEPGEPLEEAVVREVAEEAGLTVDEVSYRGSQPWPFPCSLMMGFRAHIAPDSSTEIKVDGEELTDARFFTREELLAEVSAGRVRLPNRSSIARSLIEEWYGDSIPS